MSDLGLHCLSMSHKKDARLIWFRKKHANLPRMQKGKDFQYKENEMCNCDGIDFLGFITIIIKCPFHALIKKLICDFNSLNASVIVNFCCF